MNIECNSWIYKRRNVKLLCKTISFDVQKENLGKIRHTKELKMNQKESMLVKDKDI